MKKTYKYGLANHEDTPQEYKLSAILAGYYSGFRKNNFILTQIQCDDMDVKSDGTLDFSVPVRISTKRTYLFNRIKLAWKILKGKASILYYE